MKTLADWLSHLESLHPKGQAGIELGLDRVRTVKSALQQRQDVPVIIVGGTNGKGSTCAYLEAIYSSAGYRVGCYTSPHLLQYNERVRVGRAMIDDDTLCEAFARVETARKRAGNVALTYFEFGTLAAWEVFAASKVNVVILEVGLGGRLDAVNVYDGDCAVVTGIALDHTDWLGSTREAIGFEKAGIFRNGKPAICADCAPPKTLIAHAEEIGADLHLIDRDFEQVPSDSGWTFKGRLGSPIGGLVLPSLRGAYQLGNAAAVLVVAQSLMGRLPVAMAAIQRGFSEVTLPGRFQVFGGPPVLILDVAHNPQAVSAMAANLSTVNVSGRTIAVVGMLADKDIKGALAELAGKIDVWLLASLDVPRGATADMLFASVSQGDLGGSCERFVSPEAAFARAAKLAGENDRIVAFGSFYTVAAVMRAMK